MSATNLTFNEIRPFFEDAIAELGGNKSEIKRQDLDVFCKCPVCGDSKYGNKKRLHLYQKGEVINVNCFNGDCSVKNYTPYRFFKDFAPRIFNEFKNFYRRRHFNAFVEAKTEAPKLESISAGEDLFEVQESTKIDSSITFAIIAKVEAFEFQGDDEADWANINTMLKEIKELDPNAAKEFKEILLRCDEADPEKK